MTLKCETSKNSLLKDGLVSARAPFSGMACEEGVHVHTHAHIHAYTCMHTHTLICVCSFTLPITLPHAHICTQKLLHTQVHPYAHSHACGHHIDTLTCALIHMHTGSHSYTLTMHSHTWIYPHNHSYTRTYTHSYTCTHSHGARRGPDQSPGISSGPGDFQPEPGGGSLHPHAHKATHGSDSKLCVPAST